MSSGSEESRRGKKIVGAAGATLALDEEAEAGGVPHLRLGEVEQHRRRAVGDQPVQRQAQVGDRADVESPT